MQGIDEYMKNSIFDKTDKGREEIVTRKHHLALRLRTLLVLMDGKHSVEDLLQKVSGLGLNQQSIDELLENGFIHAASEKRGKALSADSIDGSGADTSGKEITLPSDKIQIEALHQFFNETIKNTIGLRGIPLQLKAERANSVDDFRKLRLAYLDAIAKAKGNELMLNLRDRLDRLLNPEDVVYTKVESSRINN